MKKLLALSLVATMSMSTFAFASTTTGYEEVVTPIYTISDTSTATAVTPAIRVDRETLEEIVPAREYAEGIGYKVIWNDYSNSITFKKGENTFKCAVGSDDYYSNVYSQDPKIVDLETETSLIDGTAYIPKSFAKMLFDVPVVEPMPPTQVTPITPEVPVDDNQVVGIENTVDPLMDTQIAKEIAEEINDDLEDFKEDQQEYNEQHLQNYLTNGGNIDEYVVPYSEIGYEILTQNDDFVKVNCYRKYDNGSSIVQDNDVTLYDVKTGEEVSIER